MVPGLPVQVNNDVRVFERPNYVYVQTKFGLQVMWHRTFSLRISVTDDYKNKVCGMCGNYDGNPDNDWIVGPNNKMCSFEFNNRTGGSKTKHEPTFGMSWMYGNDTSSECLNSCKPFPPGPACTEEEMQAANKSCKALLESDGPLEDCIEALGDVRVTDIVKDCIFDECSAKFNGSAIVCGDASLMADECSAEAGISLVWRGPDFCPLPCPDNAFYTTCMTECNPTCGDKYGKSCTPNGICQEGCQCKNGYLFANDECILETHCGCPDNTSGGIVPIGASVVHGDCEEMCECGSHGSKLNCTPMKCRADQDCSVINGVKQCACPPLHGDINGKCVPPASCRCSGDPHCYMFDGEHFSYQGSCLYTMVQDGCQNGLPNEAPNFQVLINNNRLMGKKLASRIYDVTVLFRKMNMTVVLHQGGMVSINGDETPLPYQAFNMTISDSPNGVDLISEYGIQVFWNRIYSLVINVAGGHFDGVCGMCGTYNNNKKDDMVMGPTDQCMPNTINIAPGTLLKDEVIFGSSWFHSMDGDDKNCKTDCERLPYPLKCENKQAKKLCSNLKKPKGPLGRCIDAMGKTAFKSAYRDCLFDTCTQGEVTDKYACVAAEQIMATCENQYGIKYKWRSNKFCPQPCPDHATYLECGQKCTPNCDDPEGLRCSKLIGSNCVAGCFCDKGYIYFDGFCRPKAECKVLRRPCSNLVHPGGDGKYDARVQCLTCKDQPSDAKCRETGTWETCMAYNAICDRTIVTSSNGAVSLSRGCKARADCPERSIGEDLCTTKKGQQTCYQCNYGTLREFQQGIKYYRCQEWVNRDNCILDKDAGSKVKGLRGKRYYFSTSKCKCMAFTYNGAGGNDNNFASAGECGEACSSWRLPDRCLLPADKGTGKSPVKMFYYNAKKNRCKKFQFKGEGGNGNRYSNKKECMQTCMQCGEA
ncbi:hypothetical protein CAPTEDRAFT_226094 [Capitella teleta]|uniref:VWFD domain-containing protein n=1 Tax=Capitella teleta TaxID=283909 RepID=R7V4K6_CAPTE|nr:hypothetical protein CAPTEDRAFT_226094 [Capitella teleta]|eukprot:ELU11291.1 hypothetical protein CAPTEDRAFT_226094 [Capitella teleta]